MILPYMRRGVNIISASFLNLDLLYHLHYIMVRTRSQLENLSQEKLTEEHISVEDISSRISDLTSRFNDFLRQYEICCAIC